MLQEDLIVAFQYMKGAYRKHGVRLFREHVVTGKGNGFQLKGSRFRLDMRKKFLTVKVVRHWNRVPRETVDAPCLAVFKARLAGALRSQVW